MGLSRDLETVRRRYRWLAPIYPFFELVFLLPRGIRNKAVERLGLTAEDTVLEVGCGTGRNLPHLVAAVGAKGRDAIGLRRPRSSLREVRVVCYDDEPIHSEIPKLK